MGIAPSAWAWLTMHPDGHPLPGRVRMDLDEARQLLVESTAFAGSGARLHLWERLMSYLAEFVALELEYDERLVEFIWLGGSFVSAEPDPRNVDVTVGINVEAEARIKTQARGTWLAKAFSRRKMLPEFGVSPIRLPYKPAASTFKNHEAGVQEQAYFRERGAWDDWWQRCRTEASPAPSLETAVAVRGYLEVVL